MIHDKPFIYEERHHPECIQRIYKFENGYEASVIKSRFSYGGDKGLWELAIMKDGHLCYDTPITNDVIGYLSDEERDKILNSISLLPKPKVDNDEKKD